MDKVNILLVDDQPTKRLSYQAILEDLGENLVVAGSGREALQYLLNNECAVILLDVVMPDIDGFETAALIRQRPKLEDTPIIFLTAYSTSDLDRMKGYELGAVDYVFAPVVPEILRAKVSVFVELFRKRHELARANELLRNEIAERRIAQEKALQAERMAAIGHMVTGLAHESRNALQQIQASVEMLRRRLTAEPETMLVASIQKAQDRLHNLFEDVRAFAAPIKLSRDVHDLARLWAEAWKQLAPLRQGRAASLVEHANGMDLRCHVDPGSIQRLFLYVLENSLAGCRDPVRIEVRCAAAEIKGYSAVRVELSDNGVGLTPEQRSRLFEPFFTIRTNGTGLGMAIAKRIVEAHHGQIDVADHPGSGTAIEVILPRGPT